MSDKKLYKLIGLVSVFITSLLISNIVSSKIFMVWGFSITVGVLLYPVTFAMTDTISEIWGKKIATRIVWIGFAVNILMLFFLWVGKILPAAPFWQHQQSYVNILGAVPRITLASLIAYIISQTHDVWIFHYIKEKTDSKHLWLRNNLSTMLSQLIDSILFITIAFLGTMPASAIITMIIVQYVIKLGLAAIDTPIVYLLVHLVKEDDIYAG